MNIDVYGVFIDYRNTFDCVNHQKMINIHESTRIDKGNLPINVELYWTAEVSTQEGTTDSASIKRRVRQGYVLSPIIFGGTCRRGQ